MISEDEMASKQAAKSQCCRLANKLSGKSFVIEGIVRCSDFCLIEPIFYFDSKQYRCVADCEWRGMDANLHTQKNLF